MPATTLDLAISVDGVTLFQEGTATADSGTGDIAIAFGDGSLAHAGTGVGGPGMFDTAFADGTGSEAFSGSGNFDSAFASGTHSAASVGGSGVDSSSFDYGSAVGTGAQAESGVFGGFTGPTGGDVAAVYDPSGTFGSDATAGNGIADLASVGGDHSNAVAGFAGDFDLAGAFGDGLGTAGATSGNFLVDILPSLF
ncbi:MAG TPA: hypothetical protein VF299_05500 [Mycobacterium sp.]